MKEIHTTPPLPNVPSAQDFSKLGFVYITVLGLANQAVPHTGGWRPLATAVNYLVIIAPIVYMAFQAWPASPVGVQPDSVSGIFLTLVHPILSYDYSKLGVAYLAMLGLAEQVIPHRGVWGPWSTTANYVMRMAPIIYWAFPAWPFPLTEGSPGSNPGYLSPILNSFKTSPSPSRSLFLAGLISLEKIKIRSLGPRLEYHGLLAPAVDNVSLAKSCLGAGSLAVPGLALYLLSLISGFPLQRLCLISTLVAAFCYTSKGVKL
ncbi:hypothetical protein DSO57_1008062 [Entomophthora muscae]|uniref:Uncharacterized protein n=1 Tax=Entomophthora muscae TaxID=34485 RepID=A0ACC2S969_9FUNG|nr:hypothetical protein DSO57_1008062 [Entomophthora muscae]